MTVKEALATVLAEMDAMSPEELRADLDAHRDGAFAVAMRETAQFLASLAPQPVVDLPAVARLYTTGISRRYRRASTQPGPGEALCLLSAAKACIEHAAGAERLRGIQLAGEEAARLTASGDCAGAAALQQFQAQLKRG